MLHIEERRQCETLLSNAANVKCKMQQMSNAANVKCKMPNSKCGKALVKFPDGVAGIQDFGHSGFLEHCFSVLVFPTFEVEL